MNVFVFCWLKVWQLAWAHPRFDTLLASCSYDRKVIIWKEVVDSRPDGKKGVKWEQQYTYDGHESSGIYINNNTH